MKLHIRRLHPGEDLRGQLQAFTREQRIQAGFIVSCVGSLSQARLRYAGREEASELKGDLEIVSLVGTLSPEGCHLHAAVADAQGETRGGHVLEGCLIRTTAEIVVGEAPDVRFTREHDPATGFRELVINKKDAQS